eukprot:2243068-Pyramimonas_sp.AAC.1
MQRTGVTIARGPRGNCAILDIAICKLSVARRGRRGPLAGAGLGARTATDCDCVHDALRNHMFVSSGAILTWGYVVVMSVCHESLRACAGRCSHPADPDNGAKVTGDPTLRMGSSAGRSSHHEGTRAGRSSHHKGGL